MIFEEVFFGKGEESRLFSFNESKPTLPIWVEPETDPGSQCRDYNTLHPPCLLACGEFLTLILPRSHDSWVPTAQGTDRRGPPSGFGAGGCACFAPGIRHSGRLRRLCGASRDDRRRQSEATHLGNVGWMKSPSSSSPAACNVKVLLVQTCGRCCRCKKLSSRVHGDAIEPTRQSSVATQSIEPELG